MLFRAHSVPWATSTKSWAPRSLARASAPRSCLWETSILMVTMVSIIYDNAHMLSAICMLPIEAHANCYFLYICAALAISSLSLWSSSNYFFLATFRCDQNVYYVLRLQTWCHRLFLRPSFKSTSQHWATRASAKMTQAKVVKMSSARGVVMRRPPRGEKPIAPHTICSWFAHDIIHATFDSANNTNVYPLWS